MTAATRKIVDKLAGFLMLLIVINAALTNWVTVVSLGLALVYLGSLSVRAHLSRPRRSRRPARRTRTAHA